MYASDLRHESVPLQDKLKALYALGRGRRIDLSFRPAYLDLLKAFGNPHLHLPPVIHVAGTNGKGSTVAIMRAVLEAAGRRIHAYTSPHLCRFNERIVLAGLEIEDSALEDLIDEALAHANGAELTFFEVTTALAFAAFARNPADILLLETGLGGRMDCTNIIERPLATVITAIGFDHMEFLGNTLPAIAAEKAGIMKPGAPCVVGPQETSEIYPLLKEHAKKLNVPLFLHGEEWQVTQAAEGMEFSFEEEARLYPAPGLAGGHQIGNAGTALATLRTAGIELPERAVREGLKNASWPGRLQRLSQREKDGWEVWLDGAHNGHAARALAAWAAQKEGPLHLIVGMMGHKDPAEFLAPLLPYIDSLTAVDIPGEPGAVKSGDLLERLGKLPIPVRSCNDPAEALQILFKTQAPGCVLITGSLYLAGRMLQGAC
ncbi:MAG: bifunctional folylpolyglutamate synthase/dihydrofolate synthase [Alphaproteobacteria bacterium]|nr:bifunctional folylpolyglutamate synthase/dihydrofolate synthase [Alphaproteobacteria bacterium]